MRCVELAYEELMKICHSCSSKVRPTAAAANPQELTKFPKLNAKINEVVSDLLRERLTPTTNYVESLISIQLSYINTRHPDFIGASGAMTAIKLEPQSGQLPKITTTSQANDANLRSILIARDSGPSSEVAPTQEDELLSTFFGGEDDAYIDRVGPCSFFN